MSGAIKKPTSTNTMFSVLMNMINQKDDKAKPCFDDGDLFEEYNNFATKDETKKASKITKNINSASKNAKAQKLASNKAASLKQKGSFMGSTIKKVTTKDNTTKVKLTDSKTKKDYTVTIQYDKEGNSVHTYTLDGVKYEKIYDSNGNIIQKKQTENNITSTKTYNVVNGKSQPAKTEVTDSKNPNYKKKIYYNEHGDIVKSSVNDGITTNITDYEYDKKGKKIGTKTESYPNKSPNEKTYTTSAYKYDKNGKVTGKVALRSKPDGTTTKSKYTYNNKSDKYTITSSIEKKGNGTIIKRKFGNIKKDKNGNETRDVIRTAKTKDGKSTTLYGTETIKDGKVTEKKYYSDKDKKNLYGKYTINYDTNGNKKEIKAKYTEKGKSSSAVVEKTTTYDSITGEIIKTVLKRKNGSTETTKK